MRVVGATVAVTHAVIAAAWVVRDMGVAAEVAAFVVAGAGVGAEVGGGLLADAAVDAATVGSSAIARMEH